MRFRSLFFAYLLTLGWIFSGCRPQPPASNAVAPTADLPVVEAEAVEAGLTVWPRVVKVQGSLFADEVTTVSAKVAGRIISVAVDLGDNVDQDQLLVQLDSREYELLVVQAEAQLAQARAAIGLKPGDPLEKLNPENAPPVREARAVFDEAKQQVERLHTLYSQGAIVATDLESAQAALSVAEARYNSSLNSVREKIALVGVQTAEKDLAEQRLADTHIIAPLKGRIQNRIVSVGTYVQVGQPMLELVKTNVLRYRASVPERFAQELDLGQKVVVEVAGKGKWQVDIVRISPALDADSRSLMFEAEVPNEDDILRGGMFAQAEVILDEAAQSVTIPGSALVRFAGVEKVWLVSDGELVETVIRAGREREGELEVIEGLKPGSRILRDGRKGRAGKFKPQVTSVVDGANPAGTPIPDNDDGNDQDREAAVADSSAPQSSGGQ